MLYVLDLAHTGRPHQRVSILDDRMLTKKLLGGSLRDYDDSDGGMHSSSTSARKQSSALSSTSTKNIGVSERVVGPCAS